MAINPQIESGGNEYLNWSMAYAAKEGENECGDFHFVKKFEDTILIAAIDGLGHGASAAKASRKAVELLKTFQGESLINLVKRCDRELKYTRGVVMSLAHINHIENTMTWIGVGNVEGLLLRANGKFRQDTERIVLRGGVVGYNLPSLQASIIPMNRGDTLIFTTDGVNQEYIEQLKKYGNKPENIVCKIAEHHFMRSDDALVIAAKYTGKGFDEG